jgi:hypothetical protein
MKQVSVFLFLTIASCTSSTSLTENEKEEITAEVRLALTNYNNDIRKSGLTAEFKYLDHSQDFFWVPPGSAIAISYDSVAEVLNQNASRFTSVDNAFSSLQIIPLSNELASYSGQLKSTMTDTSGVAVTVSLIETGVMIKRKEGWKLLHGQTTLLNP